MMTGAEKRAAMDDLADELKLPLLLVDGHDDAIVGLGCQFDIYAIVYDRAKILEQLVMVDGMSMETAEEHFDFNIAGGFHGKHTPIFMTKVDIE